MPLFHISPTFVPFGLYKCNRDRLEEAKHLNARAADQYLSILMGKKGSLRVEFIPLIHQGHSHSVTEVHSKEAAFESSYSKSEATSMMVMTQCEW